MRGGEGGEGRGGGRGQGGRDLGRADSVLLQSAEERI